jgi:hypothetical protein
MGALPSKDVWFPPRPARPWDGAARSKAATNAFLAVLVVGSTDLIAYLALRGASSPVRVGVLAGLPPIALALATVVRRIVGPGR